MARPQHGARAGPFGPLSAPGYNGRTIRQWRDLSTVLELGLSARSPRQAITVAPFANGARLSFAVSEIVDAAFTRALRDRSRALERFFQLRLRGIAGRRAGIIRRRLGLAEADRLPDERVEIEARAERRRFGGLRDELERAPPPLEHLDDPGGEVLAELDLEVLAIDE